MRAQDIIRALLDVLDQESKVIDVPGEPPSRFKQILSQLNRQHSNSPDEKYLRPINRGKFLIKGRPQNTINKTNGSI